MIQKLRGIESEKTLCDFLVSEYAQIFVESLSEDKEAIIEVTTLSQGTDWEEVKLTLLFSFIQFNLFNLKQYQEQLRTRINLFSGSLSDFFEGEWDNDVRPFKWRELEELVLANRSLEGLSDALKKITGLTWDILEDIWYPEELNLFINEIQRLSTFKLTNE